MVNSFRLMNKSFTNHSEIPNLPKYKTSSTIKLAVSNCKHIFHPDISIEKFFLIAFFVHFFPKLWDLSSQYCLDHRHSDRNFLNFRSLVNALGKVT